MKKLLSLILAITMAASLIVPAQAVDPAQLNLIVPENWELEIGDSRTLDYTFTDGTTNRQITWSTGDSSIATVDEWGRVTGVAAGETTVIATPNDTSIDAATATVHVVASATAGAVHAGVVNYTGTAVTEIANLQKVVTRFASGDSGIPATVSSIADYTDYQTATTVDGAVWTITDYGVLREYNNAPTERDKQQRFMGDRYFYEKDTTTGKVLGIVADGAKGIWTIMATGVTHIAMVEMDGTDKAALMSETTQQYVSRRGLVSEAYTSDGGSTWIPEVTDNDGLWTSMYGAGELMRYAVLRSDSTATSAEVAEARNTALSATEAVLLLANVSMRGGDVDAYVKCFSDGGYTMYSGMPIYNNSGKSLSGSALIEGGDYSLSVPSKSPSDYIFSSTDRLITPFSESSWAVPADGDGNTYATQKRSLGGFIARTYYIEGVDNGDTDGIYYELNTDGTSTAVSSKSVANATINGEYFIGQTTSTDNVGVNIKTDSLMDRLWNDVIGADVDLTSVTYKGDTSTDEIIGHLFLYKLAYDILGSEDTELKEIISTTVDNFAQHLSDNNYMLLDMTGQPTTWGKMNRQYFYTYRWGASSSPLTAGVLLCAFKTAAYVTGDQKWEDEYQLAAKISDSYQYAEVMTDYTMRSNEFLDIFAAPLLGSTLGSYTLSQYLTGSNYDKELEFLTRTFAQYSDEEMAMLSFYLLFQMETDSELLSAYRSALDQWWVSMKYSENPLWYYIYQLAYPDQVITDAYGNNILETAAWSLSRHPIDTRKWCASNTNRDDIMIFNLEDYSTDLDTRGGLSIQKTTLPTTAIGANGIVGILLYGGITNGTYDLGGGIEGTLDVEYAVAAPDERALHKYNGSSYLLDSDYNPNQMEGSTTYTLPYWMGRYHGMLAAPVEYTPIYVPDTPVEEHKPTPANELFNDVPADAWYNEAVTYAVDAGLFEGTGEKTFSPSSEMTRGMLVTVLMRYAGKPTVSGSMEFQDVSETDYYYSAIIWGVENNIVVGVGDKSFAPDDSITREQAVTMLYRYAKSKGSVSAGADYSGFADASSVSSYASEAMAWAVKAGIISGRNGNMLAPNDTITRAEVATIVQRFSKL